jgi:acyl carrier protein
MEESLKNLFSEILELSLDDVELSTMQNTKSWDSFTHMSLMMSIESQVLNQPIDSDRIAELTSFQDCLKYVYSKESI